VSQLCLHYSHHWRTLSASNDNQRVNDAVTQTKHSVDRMAWRWSWYPLVLFRLRERKPFTIQLFIQTNV